MSDTGRQTTTGIDSQSAPDWQAILALHDRWLRTAVFARLRELDGVDEVMQAVAVAAIEQRAPLVDLSKAAPWRSPISARRAQRLGSRTSGAP